MRLILDANVVLSAALRDGAVRRALATTDADLFAPAVLRSELDKHIGSIARRAGIRAADAREALEKLLSEVVWVEEADLRACWKRAHRALGTVDAKDVPYLACALAVGADAIWSFDKDFDQQDLVPRVSQPDPF